jgi:hypothetical protein
VHVLQDPSEVDPAGLRNGIAADDPRKREAA